MFSFTSYGILGNRLYTCRTRSPLVTIGMVVELIERDRWCLEKILLNILNACYSEVLLTFPKQTAVRYYYLQFFLRFP